jgi:hypothetical protein
MNDAERKLGIELGFVVRHGSRGGQLINVTVADAAGTSPTEGNTRPASMAETKMWAALASRARTNA